MTSPSRSTNFLPNRKRLRALCLVAALGAASIGSAQSIKDLELSTVRGLSVSAYLARDGSRVACGGMLPLFTFEQNDTVINALSLDAGRGGDRLFWSSKSGINGSVEVEKGFGRGWKALLVFRNSSNRKQQISNVVPFGVGSDRVYII